MTFEEAVKCPSVCCQGTEVFIIVNIDCLTWDHTDSGSTLSCLLLNIEKMIFFNRNIRSLC